MSEHKIAELIGEGKIILQHLLDTNAAGSQDHAAVPKVHLHELMDKLHTAEMWLLHLFPKLRAAGEAATVAAAALKSVSPEASEALAVAGTAAVAVGATGEAVAKDLGAAGEPATAKADLGETSPAGSTPASSAVAGASGSAGGDAQGAAGHQNDTPAAE